MSAAPRRFGKSYAAKMLTAYYDCSCDSHALFDKKRIARTKSYREYLNRFNVICLDITGFISAVKKKRVCFGCPAIDRGSRMEGPCGDGL